jgi:hypothetical protein
MSDAVFDKIMEDIIALKISAYASGLPAFFDAENMSQEQLDAISKVFGFLHTQKEETIRNTLLQMSRLPLKQPKHLKALISAMSEESRSTL